MIPPVDEGNCQVGAKSAGTQHWKIVLRAEVEMERAMLRTQQTVHQY
jgi:hypothetical protein